MKIELARKLFNRLKNFVDDYEKETITFETLVFNAQAYLQGYQAAEACNYGVKEEDFEKLVKAQAVGLYDLKTKFSKSSKSFKSARLSPEKHKKAIAEFEEIEKAIQAGTFQHPELHKASKKRKQRGN